MINDTSTGNPPYPDCLPRFVGELPFLLKHGAAFAAESFIYAAPYDFGIKNCRGAAEALDDDMVAGNFDYTPEEREPVLNLAQRLRHYVDEQIDEQEVWEDYLGDPVVRCKLSFIHYLARSISSKDKDNAIRFMNEAAYHVRRCQELFEKQIAEEKENLAGMQANDVTNPAHYTVYPVQPIQITRHLDFCMGNAVKYMLRAPYKDGEKDCQKARQYLKWVREHLPLPLSAPAYFNAKSAILKLRDFMCATEGDPLWDDISVTTGTFLDALESYLAYCQNSDLDTMLAEVEQLEKIMRLRDGSDACYAGMTGLPVMEASHE